MNYQDAENSAQCSFKDILVLIFDFQFFLGTVFNPYFVIPILLGYQSFESCFVATLIKYRGRFLNPQGIKILSPSFVLANYGADCTVPDVRMYLYLVAD